MYVCMYACMHACMHACMYVSLTLFGLQADIVDFMDMAQHKWVGSDHITIRPDSMVI